MDNSLTVPKMAGDLEHLLPPREGTCQSLGFLGELAWSCRCPLKSELQLELYAAAGQSNYEGMGVLAFGTLGQEVRVMVGWQRSPGSWVGGTT